MKFKEFKPVVEGTHLAQGQDVVEDHGDHRYTPEFLKGLGDEVAELQAARDYARAKAERDYENYKQGNVRANYKKGEEATTPDSGPDRRTGPRRVSKQTPSTGGRRRSDELVLNNARQATRPVKEEVEPGLAEGSVYEDEHQRMMELAGMAPIVKQVEENNVLKTLQTIGRAAQNLPTRDSVRDEISQELRNFIRAQGGDPTAQNLSTLHGWQKKLEQDKQDKPDVKPPADGDIPVQEEVVYEDEHQRMMELAGMTPIVKGVAEGNDGYDDESTRDEYMNLQSGDYVRDSQDSSGEVFIMRGQPDDRRVRIEDNDGRGWNIAPYRLIAVDPDDQAIGHYFNDMNEASAHAKQVAAKRNEYENSLGKFEPIDQKYGVAKMIKDIATSTASPEHKKAAIDALKQQGVAEGYYKDPDGDEDSAADQADQADDERRRREEDNFTIDDIKNLEQTRDLETLKAQAKELIKGKPARRMKPEKISWFYNHIDTLKNPLAVIKMMYDLMLAGEGNKVIGSRNSMSPNSYRTRFGEQGIAEGRDRLAQI